MKEIVAQKKWVYTLYKTQEGLLLSVVCGSVGMFNVDVFLSEADVKFMNDNASYIDSLAEKIRNDPDKYPSR